VMCSWYVPDAVFQPSTTMITVSPPPSGSVTIEVVVPSTGLSSSHASSVPLHVP
jgi:hypothetical protein